MYPKEYREYPKDTSLKKEKLDSGKGIYGCEMHELNGWGDTLHNPEKEKRNGLFSRFIEWVFSGGSK